MDLGRVPLRALLELSRRGTMSAVAEALGFTPGAVSQQIAKLEASVRTPLVVRAGRGVVLTDAGRVLAAHAEEILRAEDDAVAALRATAQEVSGPLLVGMFGSTAASLLPAALHTAADRYPDLRVASREVDPDEASSAVRRGDVDLAFGLDYPHAPIPRDRGITLDRLHSERFGLVGSGLATPSGSTVDLAETAEWDWILPPAGTHFGDALRTACRLSGFEPSVRHEINETAAALALAAQGLGVAPLTPMMQQLAFAAPLSPLRLRQDVSRHIVLARRERDADRPAVRAMTAVIRSVVQDTLAG